MTLAPVRVPALAPDLQAVPDPAAPAIALLAALAAAAGEEGAAAASAAAAAVEEAVAAALAEADAEPFRPSWYLCWRHPQLPALPEAGSFF